MAVVRFGPIVQNARGALGSLVFARQGATSIVRMRPKPSQRDSTLQLGIRARYNQIATLWRTAGDELRLWWSRTAQTYTHTFPDGRAGQLTPWQLFFLVLSRQFSVDGGWWQYPEIWPGPISVSFTRLDVWPDGPVTLVNDAQPHSGDLCYNLFIHRTNRTAATFPGHNYRQAAAGFTGPYALNITTRFNAIASAPAIAEYVRWRCLYYTYTMPASLQFAGLSQVPNVGLELLTNGDMESGVGLGAPSWWLFAGAGTLTRTQAARWGDSYSARWQRPAAAGNSALYTPSTINLSPAANYILTFAAKCVSGTAWNQIYVYNPTIGFITITTAAPPIDSTWHEYSYTFAVPANGANSKLQFLNTNATAVDVHLDNVSIRRNL